MLASLAPEERRSVRASLELAERRPIRASLELEERQPSLAFQREEMRPILVWLELELPALDGAGLPAARHHSVQLVPRRGLKPLQAALHEVVRG